MSLDMSALPTISAAEGAGRPPPAVPTPGVFHEPWWLAIASDGGVREARVDSGGAVVGRLPYVVTRRAGVLSVVGMPALNHVLGPAVAPQFTGTNFPRTTRQIAIVRELLAQLPRAAHVSFRLHPDTETTLPFDAAGFLSRVYFSVDIAPAAAAALWAGMRDKTRNVIRRAEERLCVTAIDDPARFLDFYADTLRARRVRNQYDRAIAGRLLAECIRRDAGRILMATDPAGTPHAAVATVWDRRRAYYFMSARTAGSMNGAVSLLIWTALRHAAARNLIFDMDGIHVGRDQLPNLLLATGFGGTVRPRFSVRRSAALLRVAQGFRAAWTG